MQLTEFKNQDLADFSRSENRDAMQREIARARSGLGAEYEVLIAGQRIRQERKFTSINPCKSSEIVVVFQSGGRDLANASIAAA